MYSVSEGSHEGRVIDPGEDLSKDRKIDYPTETNDECVKQKDCDYYRLHCSIIWF